MTEITTITQENLDTWINALLSGDYAQGTGHLRSQSDTYCCLGVACDVLGEPGAGRWDWGFEYGGQVNNLLPPDAFTSSLGVYPWAKLPNGTVVALTELNDKYGFTFSQIADVLRVSTLLPSSEVEINHNIPDIDSGTYGEAMNGAARFAQATVSDPSVGFMAAPNTAAGVVIANFLEGIDFNEIEEVMEPDLKREWVAALRDGEYRQGARGLRKDDDTYCCLGVACDLLARKGIGGWVREVLVYWDFVYAGYPKAALPPDALRSDFGVDRSVVLPNGFAVDLPHLNDVGFTFSQIADIIETGTVINLRADIPTLHMLYELHHALHYAGIYGAGA